MRDLEGIAVLALCLTDQLFHVMVHGVLLNAVPPMRWVTDAFQVIRERGDIDWDLMLAMGRHLRVLLPLRDGLQYLVEKFEAPVPPGILAALCADRPSSTERLAHERALDPDRLQSPVATFRLIGTPAEELRRATVAGTEIAATRAGKMPTWIMEADP